MWDTLHNLPEISPSHPKIFFAVFKKALCHFQRTHIFFILFHLLEFVLWYFDIVFLRMSAMFNTIFLPKFVSKHSATNSFHPAIHWDVPRMCGILSKPALKHVHVLIACLWINIYKLCILIGSHLKKIIKKSTGSFKENNQKVHWKHYINILAKHQVLLVNHKQSYILYCIFGSGHF